MSVFDAYQDKAWPYRYKGMIRVSRIAGGIPSDPNVAESWLRTKLSDSDDIIREAVAKTMTERGLSAEDASKEVASMRHFTGFKRDDNGLYIEGRQLKAAIKEAAMVAVGSGKLSLTGWGTTRKYLKGFVAEHIFVPEERLYLGTKEATGVAQQFVHTQHGSAPHYKEYVDNAEIEFTVQEDWGFDEYTWAMIWLTGGQQGVGASRSGGFGTYSLEKWEMVGKTPPVRKAKTAKADDSEKADSEE